MRSFIPPLHFRRAPAVESALKAWTAPRLQRAMEQLADAMFATRRTPALANSLAQRALLSLAMSAPPALKRFGSMAAGFDLL